ncbi:dipeptide ABC transporter ATP-binding protein [Flavisphingomonas formosensis]|uniref:dipeptide ABC transporter ATP-binding protein n=1 Tax=Flavisphingomonas formosensis TaxID=861534 RepID=UPI0012FC6312|nr:ABC transporter ATP-binding protein [Sphingomonas formosensis]
MSFLAIRDLTVSYAGRAAVRGLSLSVGRGEIVALVGESGSGKSTAAFAAMGLLPSAAVVGGEIRIDDRAMADLTAPEQDRLRGGTLSMVFQEPMGALNPRMRIGAQVAEAIRIHHPMSRAEADARAAATLARAGLPPEIAPPTRYPHELSGGQRQRVAIAIAIAAGPALLIADEPTTALDVTTQAHILALLRRLVKEDGLGLLLVSHDLAMVAEVADRVAVMKDGAIVEEGTPEDVLRRPRADYTRRLIAAAAHVPAAPAQAPGAPLLEVRDLVRSWPGVRTDLRTGLRRAPARTTLHDASFTVAAGETVGLVGESGSGKTTLLRTVLGLDPPQGGDVLLQGRSIVRARGAALRALRRDVQAVFQDPAGSLDPRQRIERIVAEPMHLLDARPGAAERRRLVEEALEQVGLAPQDAGRFPHQFSGGQRQRIALARALIIRPKLIVLDEAVSALDMSVRAGILDLLADLRDRLGLAYLFVSHDMAMMRKVADRLIVLQAGRIVEQGSTTQLIAAPRHPYTASLLAATPDLDRALSARDPAE